LRDANVPLREFNEGLKGVRSMAEKSKSKTDVAARAESKNKVQSCKICGNKIDVVMAVSSSGKKRMRRICCGD